MERRKKKSTKLPINIVKRKKLARKVLKPKNEEEMAELLDEKKTIKRQALEKKVEPKTTTKEHLDQDYEKLENEKKMIMWSGVTFFMALIVVFWFFNIRQVFIETKEQSNMASSSLGDWKEMTGEIVEQLGEIKDVVQDIKQTDKVEKENLDELVAKEKAILPTSDDAVLLEATTTPEVAGTSTAIKEE